MLLPSLFVVVFMRENSDRSLSLTTEYFFPCDHFSILRPLNYLLLHFLFNAICLMTLFLADHQFVQVVFSSEITQPNANLLFKKLT